MEDPEVQVEEVAEDEQAAPVALVMVETDGGDVCAADGTCW